jgi:hypothetical protein
VEEGGKSGHSSGLIISGGVVKGTGGAGIDVFRGVDLGDYQARWHSSLTSSFRISHDARGCYFLLP